MRKDAKCTGQPGLARSLLTEDPKLINAKDEASLPLTASHLWGFEADSPKGWADTTSLGMHDGESGDDAASDGVSSGCGSAGCDGLDESYGCR